MRIGRDITIARVIANFGMHKNGNEAEF